MYEPGLVAVIGAGGGAIGAVVAGAVFGRLPNTGWPVLAFAVAGVAAIVLGLGLLRLSLRRSVR